MSVPVALDALQQQITEFGSHPYLITVGADGHAHVVSVTADMRDGRIAASAGRTSRRNATVNAALSMLWPAQGDGPYALIVDGDGAVDDDREEIAITPTRAVLHRVSGGPSDLPSCVPLEG